MAQKRVAVTGIGIISSLGLCLEEVTETLTRGRSCTRHVPEWETLGLKSTVGGLLPDLTQKIEAAEIPRKKRQCMSGASLYAVLAAGDAIRDAGLSEAELMKADCGCLVGSGVSDVFANYDCGKKLFEGNARRVSPYTVVHTMASSCSANVVNMFPVGGRSFSISSACATSAHNIGQAVELIRGGKLNTAIAGGAEDVNEIITSAFCAMRMALSTKYNSCPEKASRPFDAERDGFVISGGAGILILEEMEQARKRGAHLYGEISGYAATSDGYHIFLPEPEGTMTSLCMQEALKDAELHPEDIDYVNPHGTATVVGDPAETKAIRKVFGSSIPPFSSTKSMSGHAVGAAGGTELIYCLSMMKNGFIAPSINIDEPAPECEGLPIVTKTTEKKLKAVMTNNFGFGGTNATLILRAVE